LDGRRRLDKEEINAGMRGQGFAGQMEAAATYLAAASDGGGGG